MTDEQKAAYVNAQAICALAEIEAMRAENWMREMKGQTIAHGEDEFLAVPAKYNLHHNALMSLFHG